jgi:hypothetical protein
MAINYGFFYVVMEQAVHMGVHVQTRNQSCVQEERADNATCAGLEFMCIEHAEAHLFQIKRKLISFDQTGTCKASFSRM